MVGHQGVAEDITIRKDVFVYFRKKVFIVFTRIENALFIVSSVIHVIDIALKEIHRKLLVRFSRATTLVVARLIRYDRAQNYFRGNNF